MKFIVSTSALLKKCTLVNSVVPSRSVIPILGYILFEVEGNNLSLITTDLAVTIKTNVPVESKENGSIAVPASMILEILRALPEQPITFSIDTESFTIDINSSNGKYSISGESAENFPKFPSLDGANNVKINSAILAEAISYTEFVISTDDSKPSLSGLYLNFNASDLRFVGTDSNKLVEYKRLDYTSDTESNFIIPRKILGVLSDALPNSDMPIEIQYNRLNAQFNIEDTLLVARLVDGNFPNYSQVIPKPADLIAKLKINRADLLNALKRTVIFANKATKQIVFNLSGSSLIIIAEDLDYASKAEEVLLCEFEGTDLKIAFNGKSLFDLLSHLNSDEVEFGFSGPTRAAMLKPSEQDNGEELTMIVMPNVLS